MWCRGIRGATTADDNTREAILSATTELLQKIVDANGLKVEDVASAFFTASSDLNAEYPALAARLMGWTGAALMCAHEMNVPWGLARCIRVLIHWNTDKSADQVAHVYIRGAEKLRELPQTA